MSDKRFLVLLGIFFIFFIIFQQYLIRIQTPKEDILIERLSALERKIDSINSKKDSIRIIISQIDEKLDTNEQHYVETTNNILTQSDSANRAFIDEYLRQYWSKK